jgi:hypothetical protein
MTGVVEAVVGFFERRFLQNAFLPVLLFPPAAAAPVVLENGRLHDLGAAWDAQSGTLKFLEIAAYLALVWFVAAIVASQWRNLTRLFEGYPLRPIRPLYRSAVRYHRRQHRMLQSRPRFRSRRYPQNAERFMPTRLGNILRAAEEYPWERYGAPLIFVWSRLYAVLPTDFAANIEITRARYEFLLVVSTWCAAFAATSAALGVIFDAPPGRVAACFGSGMVFAYVAYVSALPAAVEYGNRLRAGFDLYRLDLLERLKLKPPRTLSEEEELWTALDNLLVPQGTPPKYGSPREDWQRERMYQEAAPPEAVLYVIVSRGHPD